MSRARPFVLAALAALFAAASFACTTDEPASKLGAQLFADPHAFTKSEFNTVSCATCHATTATPDATRLDSGYSLYGAAARSTFWGGAEIRLFDASSACAVYFMHGDPLDETSDSSHALYDFLDSITPTGSPTAPLPFTIVENIVAIPAGDATKGAAVYASACQNCHGKIHTGDGQIILPKPIIMPEYTDGYDKIFPNVPHGLVVIEKIRHGRFFNVGGNMPLYSKEVITDEQIGDLLAYLGLTSEMM